MENEKKIIKITAKLIDDNKYQKVNENINKENIIMTFQTILEELNRLYEADELETAVEEEEATEEADKVITESADNEDADAEEIEIEEDVTTEEPVADEPKQVILECANCGALVIKDAQDVTADGESDLVNMDEACQYCEESAGYKIVGAVAPYEVAEEATEEAPELEEGITDIFKSKATKQKEYEEDIKKVFGSPASSVAAQISAKVTGVIQDVASTLGQLDDSSKGTTVAKGIITLINNAKASVHKNDMPHVLVKCVRELGQKYCRETSSDLDDVKEFLTKINKVQAGSKTGYKAVRYLFEKVNKQIEIRMDRLIASLKKEYSI